MPRGLSGLRRYIRNASKRAWGSLAFILMLSSNAPSMAASGTVANYSDVMSRYGMNLLYLRRWGPFYLTRTESEVPGEMQPSQLTARFRCQDGRIKLRTVRGAKDSDNHHACEIAHRALQYVVDTLGSDGISLELVIVPPNHRLKEKRSAFGMKPKLSLGIATFDDPDLTSANIATVVAHESTHALLARLGPEAYVASEYSARYLAMCGQLVATGKIMRDRIIKPAISGDDFAAKSSQVGAAIGREVAHLFEGEFLVAESNGAKHILNRCRHLSTVPGRASAGAHDSKVGRSESAHP